MNPVQRTGVPIAQRLQPALSHVIHMGSSHGDFKRSGFGWAVWCDGDWRLTWILGPEVTCSHCQEDITHRFKAQA